MRSWVAGLVFTDRGTFLGPVEGVVQESHLAGDDGYVVLVFTYHNDTDLQFDFKWLAYNAFGLVRHKPIDYAPIWPGDTLTVTLRMRLNFEAEAAVPGRLRKVVKGLLRA